MDSATGTPNEVFVKLVSKKRLANVKEGWVSFLAYMTKHAFSPAEVQWAESRLREGVLEGRGTKEHIEQFNKFSARSDVLQQLEDFIYFRAFDTDLD